jgi:hypothetical protein
VVSDRQTDRQTDMPPRRKSGTFAQTSSQPKYVNYMFDAPPNQESRAVGGKTTRKQKLCDSKMAPVPPPMEGGQVCMEDVCVKADKAPSPAQFMSVRAVYSLYDKVVRGVLRVQDITWPDSKMPSTCGVGFDLMDGSEAKLYPFETSVFMENDAFGAGSKGQVYRLMSPALIIKRVVVDKMQDDCEFMTEVKASALCALLYHNGVSPHFLNYISSFHCPKNPNAFHIMERYDSSLKGAMVHPQNHIPDHLVPDKFNQKTQKQWETMKEQYLAGLCFQVLHGIHVYQTYYRMSHWDLSPDNVFIVNMKKGSPSLFKNKQSTYYLIKDKRVYKYNIRDETFWVPPSGALCKIADFDQSSFAVPGESTKRDYPRYGNGGDTNPYARQGFNPYYDVLYFLKCVRAQAKENDIRCLWIDELLEGQKFDGFRPQEPLVCLTPSVAMRKLAEKFDYHTKPEWASPDNTADFHREEL